MNQLAGRWAGLAALLAFALCLLAATESAKAEARRNVILFIGDGMGVSTVTAGRILAGQLAGGRGEDHSLSFERFPHVALVKTYSVDLQVPESAATITAIVTGKKTHSGVLGVGPRVQRGDCAAALAEPLTTVLERAEQAGFVTGVVSTTNITHATPAATYAHTADRDWENDALLPPEVREAGCRDIAEQLIDFPWGNGIEVLLGGGRSHFFGAERQDPEYPDQMGLRADGRNLVDEWLQGGDRAYAWRLAQLQALEGAKTTQVLGLFEPSHMQFEADRTVDQEPSLAKMTEFAINRLSNRGRGFFLLVEGGRIDHAHHFGNAHRALFDVIALDAAVAKAVAMTNPAETLLLVTADHSHTLTISGYPRRGNPILGKVETSPGTPALNARGNPYTTLGYANGPGWREHLPDLKEVDTEAKNFMQLAAYPTMLETHAGEDVAAYAMGLNADALGGVIEQNLLHNLMLDALFGPRLPTRTP